MDVVFSTFTLRVSDEAAKPMDILKIRKIKSKLVFSILGM